MNAIINVIADFSAEYSGTLCGLVFVAAEYTLVSLCRTLLDPKYSR